MSAAENKTLVRDYLEAVDTGDIAILDDYIDPDYIDHNPQPVPHIDPGLPGLKQAFPVTHAAFRDFRHELEFQLAEGDLVANRIRASGIQVGPYIGVPATQKRIEVTAFSIYRVRGRRLVEHWAIADGLRLLQQFGFLPARRMFPADARSDIGANGHQSTTVGNDPRSMVLGWYSEVLDSHNLDRVTDFLAGNFVDRSEYLLEETSRGGEQAFWSHFLTAFPDARITVEDLIMEGTKVLARWTILGSHLGPFMGVEPSGRPFSISAIDYLQTGPSGIVERIGELDTLALLFQLGAMGPPPVEDAPSTEGIDDPALADALQHV